MSRAKAYLLAANSACAKPMFGAIAHSFSALRDLGLPLDEPSIAASRYVSLNAADVQTAFRKWMRPGDLVRVSQGPAPQ